MKNQCKTILFIISLFTSVSYAQETPIDISPFIGEKLDRVERDYFHLLPNIEGFQEAVFFLNPDSSLKVKIQFKEENKSRDTILNNYKSLSRMQNHILQVVKNYISDVEPDERGKYCSVFLVDSSEFSGELLAVRQQSVLIYPFDQKAYEDAVDPFNVRNQVNEQNPFNVNSLDASEIDNVHFTEKSRAWSAIYPFIGMIVGAFVGYNIAENHKIENPDFFSETKESFGGMFAGMLVGGLVTLPLVFILPIETTSEAVIKTPFSEDDLEGLRERSRYPDEEPYFLQIIK